MKKIRSLATSPTRGCIVERMARPHTGVERYSGCGRCIPLAAAFAFLLAAGCEAPAPIAEAGGGGGPADGDADTDVDTGGDADGDGDADADTGTETDEETDPEPDCDELPAAPDGVIAIGGVTTGSAMAFGDDGVLVTVVEQSLDKTQKNEESAEWIADSGCARGLAVLPTGDFVCCGADAVYVFDEVTGTRRTALAGLREPIGLAAGHKGEVYVAERLSGDVIELYPYTGATRIVAEGLPSPNGIALDAERGSLYVSGGCNTVYLVRISASGSASTPELLYAPTEGSGAPCFGDLEVDACGNLYALAAGEPRVLRVSPEVRIAEVFADLRDSVTAAYDFRWGPGAGGFRGDALYVLCSDDLLLELPTGGAKDAVFE
jgi:hypothetical protein